MALSRKLMIGGEEVIATTRTHVKVLIIPVLVLLLACGAGGYFAARLGDSGDGIPRWIVLAAAVLIILWFSVRPFVMWFTWTYTLTNKRVLEQRGVLTRTGRIIPLSRINDVAYEKNLNDRLLGCGTLIIHDASEQSGLELRDIPNIEDFHRTVTNLIFEAHGKSDESV